MYNIDESINKERAYSIFKKLININSVNPSGNEMDVVRYILSVFDKCIDKINYTVIDHGQNRGSLIIKIKGANKKPPVAFLGHIDTVPEGNVDLWKHPPFEGYIDGDLVYGRGTSDMKGGVTSMILSALFILENSITPVRDIYYCFTADEESEGMGILSMIEGKYIDDASEIFICEPSDSLFGIAEKGTLWLEIKAKGRMSHASMPQLGINSIEKIMEFINSLRKTMDTDTIHEYLGRNTISVTKINGGIKTNIIPDETQAFVDIRLIPGYENSSILEHAKDIKNKMEKECEGLKIDFDVKNNRPALEADKNSAMQLTLKNIYKEMGLTMDYKGIYFYTDASQFIPYKNIPFIILGPGKSSMAHQLNECCSLKSVVNMGKVYSKYIISSIE